MIYARCSTDRQEDSIDTQVTLCTKYIEEHGWELVRVYADPDVSAAKVPTHKRPVGSKLLDDALNRKRDFDCIVILAYDRAFRNRKDDINTLDLLDVARCDVVSLRDTYDRKTRQGRLIHGIMSVIREDAAAEVGDRVKEKHRARAYSGQWIGGRQPFGLAWGKAEQKFEAGERAGDVLVVFQTFVDSNANATETARRLNTQGMPSPRGTLWNVPGVLNIVRNPLYRCKLHFNGVEYDAPGIVPEIVPADLAAKAVSMCACMPKMTPWQRTGNNVYNGLLQCAACGDKMMVRVSALPDKRQYISWCCKNRDRFRLCDSRYVSHTGVESLVGECIRRLAPQITPGTAERPPQKPKRDTEKRVKALETKRERARNLWLAGKVYRNEAEFISDIESIDRELSTLREVEPEQDLPALNWPEEFRDLSGWWSNAPAELKRRLLLEMGAEIVIGFGEGNHKWAELRTPFAPAVRVEGWVRGMYVSFIEAS